MRRPDRATRVGPGPSLTAGPIVAVVAVVCALLGAVLTASAPPAGPQAAAAKTPQKVVLSTGEFHGYAATADYLKKVAAAYPAITELVEIGRSAGNRPIFVLVVSNMKTGVALDALVPLQNPRQPAVNNVTPMKPLPGEAGAVDRRRRRTAPCWPAPRSASTSSTSWCRATGPTPT